MSKKNRDDIISARRQRWIEKWLDALMQTYPDESARFFKDTTDPFANPVGATMKKGITDLFDVVAAETYDPEAAHAALEPMIRVRAIQEFAPSQAVGFVTEIKSIIRRDAGGSKEGHPQAEKLQQIGDYADRALLAAFDIYMNCKKKVYELRARQARDSVSQLLIKKELISELPDVDPAL
ncbi:MAG: RsbRD N-terminal domain-containing protein [Desulfobacteraceae bacterium]|nr:RsbRD N-terminal domain-containing protein [Desulfobacteraceae bacterium]